MIVPGTVATISIDGLARPPPRTPLRRRGGHVRLPGKTPGVSVPGSSVPWATVRRTSITARTSVIAEPAMLARATPSAPSTGRRTRPRASVVGPDTEPYPDQPTGRPQRPQRQQGTGDEGVSHDGEGEQRPSRLGGLPQVPDQPASDAGR